MRTALKMLVLASLVPCAAQAHAHLISPAPRTTQSLKAGPCGGVPRTGKPTVFEPGQTITVVWAETQTHPGSYRIAFSPANDLGFDDNVLKSNIPNPGGVQATNSTQVTLPNVTCSACTLQLIQVMTNTNPPSNYYSCADIALEPKAQDAGTPDAGAPEPVDAGTPEEMDAGAPAEPDAGAPHQEEDAGHGDPLTEEPSPPAPASPAPTTPEKPHATGGCGASSAGGALGGALALLGGLGLAARRRTAPRVRR